MITVLLAFIFLGERLRVLDLIFLGLLAAGIFTVVLGAKKTANP
jgi:drug/metabolite transporter (DMT)-like permease